MSIEVKVPVLPESVSDATIAAWHKNPGDAIKRDENLVDLETDKVVLEVPAPVDGILKEIRKNTGETVGSQDVIAIIEEGAAKPDEKKVDTKQQSPAQKDEAKQAAQAARPVMTKDEARAVDKAQAAPKGAEDLSPAARRVATEEKIDPS
nr:dihydrolipoamide succinyltransferase [Pseudomonadota bacterium]